jgi:hypothetical protein
MFKGHTVGHLLGQDAEQFRKSIPDGREAADGGRFHRSAGSGYLSNVISPTS